ncbi:MAG: carboxypeptidase regulatory-like domain-containing protein [Candidatus Omnitrophica bacterium]|nr:carboxypeptidase regulatory-like domain-containing protein [Candidatus Omnitrophota bacterium]
MKTNKILAAIFTSTLLLWGVSPAFAGDVTGSVSFTGTAPAQETLNMGADPTCASAHSGPVYSESVVVNDNGTLKNVFVYVKQGLEGQNFPAPKEAVAFDQSGCHYTPHVLGVQVGQPVEIRNSDATLHNVHSLAKNSKEFNLGMPIKGMKLKKTFDKEEVMVKVKCDVHPWMNAYIGVLTHPFYGISGDDGSFMIKGLPAGTYTLEAWHETYGTQTQEVTVGADGSAEVSFSFAG